VLTDQLVSRQHAEIRLEKDKFVLYDLNSTGGTVLDGKKINKCVLNSGDCFLLAGVPIVFAHNLPQLGKKAKADTGELDELGPDNEPTVIEKDLDWRA
jgi:pSer/pThr/pTyr-binding forkhead associated (FHA) protein